MRTTLLFATLAMILSSNAMGQKTGRSVKAPAPSSIYKIEELNARRIDNFDRDRTLVILPVGMLEQHGPHLPIGSDTLGVRYAVDEVSRRLSRSLPGWNIVLMPAINYGEGGANEIGNIQVHPGTYEIRQSTLRSIVADVGGQLAQNRFKWIYVIHGHGSPRHNIAISEASDFVSETFGITMLNLQSMAMADPQFRARSQKIAAKYYSSAELTASGVDVHAGLSETSGMIALTPRLVSKGLRSLPSHSGQSFGDLRRIALEKGWPGYFSTPAKANARYGKEDNEAWVANFTDMIERSLRGENMFGRPRYPDQMMNDPAVIQINKDAVEHERAFELKLESWLKRRVTKP
jgi:creatinine amidohydrolase/Fe(II)-dependent formamide hydrolase-like protein